jgi:hypothetical protein
MATVLADLIAKVWAGQFDEPMPEPTPKRLAPRDAATLRMAGLAQRLEELKGSLLATSIALYGPEDDDLEAGDGRA